MTQQRILFIDLAERDRLERARMRSKVAQYDAIEAARERTGGLSEEQKADRAQLAAQLARHDTTDRLFQAVSMQIGGTPIFQIGGADVGLAVPLKYGFVLGQYKAEGPQDLSDLERQIVGVCGLLQLDNVTDPDLNDFVAKVTIARGEYDQNKPLFDVAFQNFSYRHLVALQSQIAKGLVDPRVIGFISGPVTAGTQVPSAGEPVAAVSGRNLAAVVRRVRDDRISPNDPYLTSRMDNAFNLLTGLTEGAPPSAIEIMLPDLEESVDVEIVKDNLDAAQAIYFSWQLEEMRMFQVVDKIVDLFRQGLLPLGRNSVGDKLFKYFKTSTERITEAERRELYFRMFGAPGGNPAAGEPNRDFNELWMRFVSAVSSFARQNTVERILRNSVPMAVSQEQVRKSARDLGANLSRNGYGIAFYAATELQQTILTFKDMLQDAELRSAFGARDMWQVIDQVNVNYLGGARNTHRYRTQSRAGAIIIRWLAERTQRLANISAPVLSVDEINNPQMRIAAPGHNPVVDPSDWDLVAACEQWLAVAGVQDQNVEQYAQPIEAPTMTSRPIDIPQAARDVLASMNVNLPV